jgi:hypothetical protein
LDDLDNVIGRVSVVGAWSAVACEVVQDFDRVLASYERSAMKDMKTWPLELLTLPKIHHTTTLGQEKKRVESLKENRRGLVNRTLAWKQISDQPRWGC